MKQIIQSLKTGETILLDVPKPVVQKDHLLIRTTCSLVSLGTEKMLVDFGKANLVNKIRQQPDKVKQVLAKMKTEGLSNTISAVRNKLDQPIPLGYCNVGVVEAIGPGVKGFQIGDRVASNGPHAEFVSVPQNLCAVVPKKVSDLHACFTVIGSIGLQSIRLIKPELGETIVVVGLGLIGLITAQLLQANGCSVIGIDIDEEKVSIATELGVLAVNSGSVDPVAFVSSQVDQGADAIIITASTSSNEIIANAAKMCRPKGRIVLVGVIGLELNRADFYEKELSFQVSCSYGPGRYDEQYEKGIDYPLGHVRWTARRNFEALLRCIETNQIQLDPLITKTIDLNEYKEIYNNLAQQGNIATILTYAKTASNESSVSLGIAKKYQPTDTVVGIIGAGNFTSATLLPALQKTNIKIKWIASAKGLTSTSLGKKYGIEQSTSDINEILDDSSVNAVIITTRHHLHGQQVLDSIAKGKHIFVEKPLAINENELSQIQLAFENGNSSIMVGFNRRFSPHVQKIKELIPTEQPKSMVALINAGFIPSDHWIHDEKVGGGRIIGEACHFLDLFTYISGSSIDAVNASTLGEPQKSSDNVTIQIKFRNGDIGTIHYWANGNKKYPKEVIHIFSEGSILVLNNFRELKGYGFKKFSKIRTKLNKGHQQQFSNWHESLKSGRPTIPFEQIVNVTKASFCATDSLLLGDWVSLHE